MPSGGKHPLPFYTEKSDELCFHKYQAPSEYLIPVMVG
jgi:hypothetical protein